MSRREIKITGLGADPNSQVHIPFGQNNVFAKKPTPTANKMFVSTKDPQNSFMEVIEEDQDQAESPKSALAGATAKEFGNTESIVGGEEEEEEHEMAIVRTNPYLLEYADPKDNPFVFVLEEQEDNQETLLVKLKDMEKNLSKEMDQVNNLIGLTDHSASIINVANNMD